MRNIKFLSVALLTGAQLFAQNQLQIRKFRFNRHPGADFERLVLEFEGNAKGLNVRSDKAASGKEAAVAVDQTTLVGAIPESAINESFTAKSHYIGPISINTDSPTNGFTVRTFLKEKGLEIDSFALSSPNRMVIDVYPKGSQRASGRDVLGHAAGSVAHKEPAHVERSVASASASDAKAKGLFCFPTSAQVKAKIGFERYNGNNGVGVTVNAQGEPNYNDSVTCYPANARVNPTVTFSGNESPISKQEAAPSRIFSSTTPLFTPAPPVAPKEEVAEKAIEKQTTVDNTTAQLNKEADEALSVEEERPTVKAQKRAVAAEAMLVPFQDGFNKNNPPPTLGKSLLPPGQGTGAKKATGMPSPGALLK